LRNLSVLTDANISPSGEPVHKILNGRRQPDRVDYGDEPVE
jgi:hypothetical protein